MNFNISSALVISEELAILLGVVSFGGCLSLVRVGFCNVTAHELCEQPYGIVEMMVAAALPLLTYAMMAGVALPLLDYISTDEPDVSYEANVQELVEGRFNGWRQAHERRKNERQQNIYSAAAA